MRRLIGSLPLPRRRTTAHEPVQASLGVTFVLARIEYEALAWATPDIAVFRSLTKTRLVSRVRSQQRRPSETRPFTQQRVLASKSSLRDRSLLASM